jgi:ubiquinone/menaquinone biosynthesis C-methylase UbiE
MNGHTGSVAHAHNQMAEEYDDLNDVWYPWLFAQIHEFIAEHLPGRAAERRAVDIGCGTGFQSFLLARAGYEVTAFDVADRLLEVARQKIQTQAVPPLKAPPLFRSNCSGPWLDKHHARLAYRLEELRAGRPVQSPEFQLADLMTFDFGEGQTEVLTCCGSVLSFVPDYAEAIRKMAAGLKPGGQLFLEVEQKCNLDLFWPLIDRLLGGVLRYDQSWREVFANLFAPPGRSVRVDYPFELHGGGEVILPIWLFSVRELTRIFRACGLRQTARIGIHQVTNLLPSTVLHGSAAFWLSQRLFGVLRPLDALAAQCWPFWRLGCSVLYCLQKSGDAP